MQQTIRDHS